MALECQHLVGAVASDFELKYPPETPEGTKIQWYWYSFSMTWSNAYMIDELGT